MQCNGFSREFSKALYRTTATTPMGRHNRGVYLRSISSSNSTVRLSCADRPRHPLRQNSKKQFQVASGTTEQPSSPSAARIHWRTPRHSVPARIWRSNHVAYRVALPMGGSCPCTPPISILLRDILQRTHTKKQKRIRSTRLATPRSPQKKRQGKNFARSSRYLARKRALPRVYNNGQRVGLLQTRHQPFTRVKTGPDVLKQGQTPRAAMLAAGITALRKG